VPHAEVHLVLSELGNETPLIWLNCLRANRRAPAALIQRTGPRQHESWSTSNRSLIPISGVEPPFVEANCDVVRLSPATVSRNIDGFHPAQGSAPTESTVETPSLQALRITGGVLRLHLDFSGRVP